MAEETNQEQAESAASSEQPQAVEAEPAERLSSKEARKRARSTASGQAAPERSAAERAAERAQRRSTKAGQRRKQRAAEKEARGERREGTPPVEREPGPRKVRQGTVVSSKPEKTITVRIEFARRHPVYEKVVRRSATIHAHDERNEAGEGDVVRVVESRPLSRTKRWRLVEIIERAR